MTETRQPSAIDQIANEYFEANVALSPIELTYLGRPERQDELDDFSPAGLEQAVALARTTLAQLEQATPVDEVDRVTVAVMQERLGLRLEEHERGYDLLSLNNITSGAHAIRGAFDLMPMDTDEQWATIARRLHATGGALDGWFESQHAAVARGVRPARRQVTTLAEQIRSWVSADNFYDELVRGATLADGAPLADETRQALQEGVDAAKAAMEAAATRLEAEFLPVADEADAVGRERYQLSSRFFVGATIDLEETYEWGKQELARITAMMEEVAQQIKPGASVKEAMDILDADPRYQIHGTEALQEWMQKTADQAINELADVHFDVPEQVRVIEGMIAPTQDGGIYYTGPSDDFSRPGRMWWSVPPGVTEFGTWREKTTVYHEGVPGHHLQIAQTIVRREQLNNYRRMGAWCSGHGEGWALYSEWLMADLGYMDDPGDRMGLLDGQSLRAARVVLDIGFHCGFEAPDEVGGGEWTYDKAWEFLSNHVNMSEGSRRFELHRYLGWPGQAPSYKIGERLWLNLRDELKARQGDAFSLKDFHRRALDLGGMGLETLRAAVLGEL